MEPTALTLPDELRHDLSQPWGPVVDTATLQTMLRPDDLVLAVGDVVSMTLQEIGIQPKLFVCDYKTQRHDDDPALRQALEPWGDHEVRVENPAAGITKEAWLAIREAIGREGMTRIVVSGEEDMLGIPCFLEAPEGAIVVYGLPGRGVVVCEVTEALQEKVAALAAKMA